ncbi:hypothetical protein HDV62DRAFT_151527 [Trichoderma sp. SZMC 28011]
MVLIPRTISHADKTAVNRNTTTQNNKNKPITSNNGSLVGTPPSRTTKHGLCRNSFALRQARLRALQSRLAGGSSSSPFRPVRLHLGLDLDLVLFPQPEPAACCCCYKVGFLRRALDTTLCRLPKGKESTRGAYPRCLIGYMSVEDYFVHFFFVMGNAVTGQYWFVSLSPHKHTYMPHGSIRYLPMLMDSQSPCNSIELLFP